MTLEEQKIFHSEEYAAYLETLCKIASRYISRIRVQYAAKAWEMFQNETVRRIVSEYAKELEELERHRLMDFKSASEHEVSESHCEDWCLSKATSYADTIHLLFDIQ